MSIDHCFVHALRFRTLYLVNYFKHKSFTITTKSRDILDQKCPCTYLIQAYIEECGCADWFDLKKRRRIWSLMSHLHYNHLQRRWQKVICFINKFKLNTFMTCTLLLKIICYGLCLRTNKNPNTSLHMYQGT